MLGRAALRGALAGLAGTAAMTLAEQVEQSVTHRPDSYVPARTLTALTTRRRLPGSARAAQAEVVLAGYGPQLAAIAQSAGTTQSRMAAFLTSDSAADVVQQMTTLDLIAAHRGDAGAVLEAALAQVGAPYVGGGTGPDGFDCSGLTSYAYAAAGVSLPHSSAAQARLGVAVSRSDLQPGDLVYFYSPVSHVGLYIGGGKMVHARTFGSPVAVTSVDMNGYAGARRVV